MKSATKFVDVKNDIAFRKIFGNENKKIILISFLNAIVFEPLLYLADDAFEIKMNVPFNYMPTFNYETQSNKSGWQLPQ